MRVRLAHRARHVGVAQVAQEQRVHTRTVRRWMRAAGLDPHRRGPQIVEVSLTGPRKLVAAPARERVGTLQPRRRPAAAIEAAAAAVLFTAPLVSGWPASGVLRLGIAVAGWVLLAAAIRDLRKSRQVWREGSRFKRWGRQLNAETRLMSELNTHLDRLVAAYRAGGDTAAQDGLGPARGTDPIPSELLSTVDERRTAARDALARAIAIGELPYLPRMDAMVALIEELEVSVPRRSRATPD